MNSQLEQAAAVAPPARQTPSATHADTGAPAAQLRNLSVEHAAIALKLSRREREIVLCLGRGMSDKEMATSLVLAKETIRAYVSTLYEKTRMTRLSLAVLGYQLRGQENIEWKTAA